MVRFVFPVGHEVIVPLQADWSFLFFVTRNTDVPALRGSGDHVFVAMSETSLFLQRATSTSNFEPHEETEEQHVHWKYRTY